MLECVAGSVVNAFWCRSLRVALGRRASARQVRGVRRPYSIRFMRTWHRTSMMKFDLAKGRLCGIIFPVWDDRVASTGSISRGVILLFFTKFIFALLLGQALVGPKPERCNQGKVKPGLEPRCSVPQLPLFSGSALEVSRRQGLKNPQAPQDTLLTLPARKSSRRSTRESCGTGMDKAMCFVGLV